MGLIASGCAQAPVGPPNLILVSLDTFRADHVGAFGSTAGLTPNLDRFAAESTIFVNAYSQAIITGPSHASVMTSRYPTEIAGTSRAPAIGKDMYTLPEVLKVYGYETGAVVAGGDLNPAMGPTRGFDQYQSSVDFGSLWHTIPMAVQWLDDLDKTKPFFLFLHGYDTHSNYLKPTPYGLMYTGQSEFTPFQQQTLNGTEKVLDGHRHGDFALIESITKSELRPRSPESRAKMAERVENSHAPAPTVSAEDEALIRKVYDGAVSYADTQFGLFMAQLEARGLLENTAVMVMGDHGEALGEKGLFHRCCAVDDYVSHVPLMLRLPQGKDGGRQVTEVVELVDILPTLLDLAGAQAPAGIRGMSLMPAVRGEAFQGHDIAFTQGGTGVRIISARSAKGRLSYTGVQAISDVLGDVIAAARLSGPAFETTLDDTAEQARLRTAMVQWVGSLAPSPLQAAVLIPDALRDEIRAHGYWDAQ